jgi:hypothetical protein
MKRLKYWYLVDSSVCSQRTKLKSWYIKMSYEDIDGKQWTFRGCHDPDKSVVERAIRNIMTQLKGFDNELVTAAFEQAMLGDTNGSNSN